MSRPAHGPVNPEFGAEVYRFRVNVKHQSAREVARELGLGLGTIYSVERGASVPDLFTFAKLVRWRGVSAEHALKELGA